MVTLCNHAQGQSRYTCRSKLFGWLQASAAVWAVKTRVETAFDEKEFLEGAKDAWVAGNSLVQCWLVLTILMIPVP